MRYIDSWASEDRKTLVYFRPEVIQTFECHRQTDAQQPESGGILLGCRRGRHFEIMHATTPFPKDRRWRTGFIREREGHQAVATRLWAASKGIIDYVGEWHTHPELTPRPSTIDYREWSALVSQSLSGVPLIIVIAGITTLYTAHLMHGRIMSLNEAKHCA